MTDHRTLPCEGSARTGTSWNHSDVRGGEEAFRGACSRCVPGRRFDRPSDNSLGEVKS